MDTQPERFKDFGKRVEVFWDGDSVFYRGTVTAYSTTSGKHTILYDDNDVERVCLKVRAKPVFMPSQLALCLATSVHHPRLLHTCICMCHSCFDDSACTCMCHSCFV